VILTGGPTTTAQHLQQASPTIRHYLTETYLTSDEPDDLPTPPTIRPNIKWSKLLINSVPTGVSHTRKAMTPDECNTALASDNPAYAILNITQKPSWVRNPTSYSEGAVSSLVVAFEDPDGSLAHGLLASKMLYIFGHLAAQTSHLQQLLEESRLAELTPVPNPADSLETPDSPTEEEPIQNTKGKRRTRLRNLG